MKFKEIFFFLTVLFLARMFIFPKIAEAVCVNCNGCCSGSTCYAGTSDSQCGWGGSNCVNCSATGKVCSSGSCVAPPSSPVPTGGPATNMIKCCYYCDGHCSSCVNDPLGNYVCGAWPGCSGAKISCNSSCSCAPAPTPVCTHEGIGSCSASCNALCPSGYYSSECQHLDSFCYRGGKNLVSAACCEILVPTKIPCNGICPEGQSDKCASWYCYATDDRFKCRNFSCPAEASCICPPPPTSTPCPAAQSCPACRTTATSVPNGSCGSTSCPINCWTNCVGDVCCPIPPAPTGLSCNIVGGNVTWNAVSGADHYPFRIDDQSNPWTGTCSTINPGDVCEDVYGTSRPYTFGVGKSYGVWVHTVNYCGNWSSGYTSITCNGPTPTPTCAPNDPSQPQLRSPLNDPAGNTPIITTEVTLQWWLLANWGTGCPASNNKFKVYLTSDINDVSDGDLSNEGGNLICNVDQSTLECFEDRLDDMTNYFWQVEANNGSRKRLSAIWSFKVDTSPDPWFQTKDGDVHSKGSIASEIPSTCNAIGCSPACVPSLSLDGGGGSPGVVSYAGSLSLGTGNVSSTNWQANTASVGSQQMGFDYLLNRLNPSRITLSCTDCDFPSTAGTYYIDNSQEIRLKGTIGLLNKIIIFATGPVRVMENITVSNGGFFALITDGNLSFDPLVTDAHGVYLTDGVLSIPSSGTLPDLQFKGEGAFIGWGGVDFKRDLEQGNKCTAPAFFTGRPDFYINAPKDFLFTPSVFQEVAP